MKLSNVSIFHVNALVVLDHEPNISIKINDPIVDIDGYCLAWCEDCSDGINDNRDECDLWVVKHAKERHGWEV